MANGVVGLTRPAAGQRDIVGMRNWRLCQARERLVRAGRVTSALTLQDLEAEAQRWERANEARDQKLAELQRERAERQAAIARLKSFIAQVEQRQPGQILGPDEDGGYWRVTDDDELEPVAQP